MSDPFVGPVPMRWEFDTLLNNLSAAAADLDTERPPDRYAAARADVCRAFDAQAARIAELESPAHRASIAREFCEETENFFIENCNRLYHYQAAEKTLARWEAAAKEGE